MRSDKVINCPVCKQDFVFTQEEQDFYVQKDLEPPVNCLICRTSLKTAEKDQFRGKIKK